MTTLIKIVGSSCRGTSYKNLYNVCGTLSRGNGMACAHSLIGNIKYMSGLGKLRGSPVVPGFVP